MNNCDGILLIDKPQGLSSAGLVARLKRTLALKKAGHAGTLDPFATGLMVICLGKATRISRYFLGGDKSYVATLRLGCTTDTLDPEGQITATAAVPFLNETEVCETFARFTGPLMQAPPVYSALKHKGVPLYRLARQGKPVQKPPRPVIVHSLHLLELQLPEIRFAVHCSSGTYIRTLAADLAEAFGTVGYLAALRRTATCGFTLEDACTLDIILPGAETTSQGPPLISMAHALGFLPEICANNTLTEKIFHGKVLCTADFPDAVPDAGPVRIVDAQGRLMAVIRKEEDQPDRFCYDAVFMHGPD